MTSALAADLGADSLDTTELVIELESEFEIEFGAEQNQVRTVGDVVTIVERAMGEQRQTG
jgi:acyl carrier protein